MEKYIAVQAPTGLGKSMIARTIQRATNAAILTPSNVLLDQYVDTYPDLNYLRGMGTYKCDEQKMSCEDVKLLGLPSCSECPYKTCQKRAKSEPTVFNPLSYFYSGVKPDVIIVDEAHTLPDMLKMLTGQRFASSQYKLPPANIDRPGLVSWMREQAGLHKEASAIAYSKQKLKEALAHAQRYDRIKFSSDEIENGADVIWYRQYTKFAGKDQDVLAISPIGTPRRQLDQLFGDAKVILMSATLPRSWAADIFGTDRFEYLDIPSPIPVENRQVIIKPAGLTAGSKPEDIARWAEAQIKQYGGPAILHTTYKMGMELAKFVPGAFIHTPETKRETMERFKKEGGLWIAAGCSEGVDLPGDTARLNLIPVLPFADARTPEMEALKQRPGGVKRYKLETMVDFIQQVGRTTRSAEDYSVTVCGDGRVFGLISELRKELPQSFLDSIKMERV